MLLVLLSELVYMIPCQGFMRLGWHENIIQTTCRLTDVLTIILNHIRIKMFGMETLKMAELLLTAQG